MTVNFAAKTVTVLAVLLAGLSASGCYYMQAARGQLEVMRRSEPIETVVAEPGTPGSLSRRLRLVQPASDEEEQVGLAPPDGFEPPTRTLGECRSIH